MQIIGKNGTIFNVVIKKDNKFYSVKIVNDENKIMGELSFLINNCSAFLYTISTKQEFQHMGVGQALLDVFEYISAKQRCFHIEGQYFPQNIFAKPFYLKNNYYIDQECNASYIYKFLDADLTLARIEPNIIRENELTYQKT